MNLASKTCADIAGKGHLNIRSLQKAIRTRVIQEVVANDVVANEHFECNTCVQGKMNRIPFPKGWSRATELGELIHSDVCGPMRYLHRKKTLMYYLH